MKRSPLGRSVSALRRTRLSRVGRRAKREEGAWRAAQRACLKRDAYVCQRCKAPCTTDPHTSHAAARSLIPSRIRRAQAAVLRTLTAIGPCTDHELVEKMGLEGEYVSPSGIRTRRSELVILGRARDTGKLAKSAISNRQCILWEAI